MRRAFLVDNLDLEAATGVAGARWEHFQIAHLDDETPFRIETKSRQIAWSWTIAAEAVADALSDLWHDDPRDSIFVSINQEEAAEKIRYAHRILATLRDSPIGKDIPALIRDNTMGIELANGARLTSLPARPPRGRARANVYLDEFAHVPNDRAIYTAALPIISKGGRLRIGSSPFGAAGQFWEIASESLRTYPGYTRAITPWWTCYAFSTDPPTARRLAPAMATAQRIALFGNSRIAAIYANLEEGDFQQEYECHRATTLVLMADGSTRQVIYLDNGDKLVYNDGGKLRECSVTRKWKIGMRSVIEVTTETGSTFAASTGHKVKGRNGPDPIDTAPELPKVFFRHCAPGESEALARVIAFNLGDGTIARRTEHYKSRRTGEIREYEYPQASFYAKDQRDLYALTADLVESGICSKPPTVLFKKGSRPEYDAYQVHITRASAQKLIEAGCVTGKKTDEDYTVPEWIANGPAQIKAEFIAALFGAEGTTPREADGGRTIASISIRMFKHGGRKGDRFFDQILAMLSEFSIGATVTITQIGDTFDYFLYINSGTENAIRFFDRIGYRYAIDKEEKAFLWREYLAAYERKIETYPRRAKELRAAGLTYKQIGAALHISAQQAHNLVNKQRLLPPRHFERFAEWTEARYIDRTLYLKIEERRIAGDEDVYNITVDSPDHSYLLADGTDNYNCNHVDESRSYFTWEEIKAATRADLVHATASVTGPAIAPALAAIDEIAGMIRTGAVEEYYTAGYDVGRTHDRSELVIAGLATTDDYPIRLMITLDNTPYNAQQQVISHALDKLPITRLWIDRNGIGSQLAEEAEAYAPAVAHGAAFTAQSKQDWATTAKRLMQQGRVKIPANRDLSYQIHSIRKLITASKQNIFDVDANEKHHADKAWAMFLALAAAEAGRRQPDPTQMEQMFAYLG